MKFSKIALLTTTALLAVSSFAYAADKQQATDPSLEEITVTGSRIERAGYEAPTPVTMANRDEIQAAATPSLGEYLGRLPSFGTANTSRNMNYSISGGGAGSSLVNLRQLGLTRTLVLFGGRRVVTQNLAGGVDLNMIPSSLVQRVDIVTGGASAAWGSDALAGVVNVLVNKEFEGVEVSGESSMTSYGDGFNYKTDIVAGASFNNGKGHAESSLTFDNTPGYTSAANRKWLEPHLVALFSNPAYVAGGTQPKLILLQNAGYANGTRGGLITAGPLKYTQFVGNGIPVPYVINTVQNTTAAGPDAATGENHHHPLLNPTRTYNFYQRTDYAVSDDLNINYELSYGQVQAQHRTTNYKRLGNITVTIDNAFLPAVTKAAMQANGITSFLFGTTNENLGTIDSFGASEGVDASRKLYRGVVGVDGKIFTDWKWDAYYSHAKVRNYGQMLMNPYIPNYNRAIDSVVSPTGKIVCRSTLIDPTNGCMPLNLFGIDVVSNAAKDYVQNVHRGIQLMKTKLDVAAASISGSPGSSWAGPIDVAAGLETRWDAANVTVDALSPAREFYSGNFSPLEPVVVNVREGFMEINVPLAKDQAWARSLDFNAAARVTDYSTSGLVTTWKAGLGYQATDEIRARITRSRDIRAPSLNELYSPGQFNNGVTFDAVKGTSNNAISSVGGNPNLTPEIGSTLTGGLIYSPGWLDGFQASIDYFDIKIKDAIVTPARDTILNGCIAGNLEFCKFVHRDAAGFLIQYDLIPANVAASRTNGIDLETSYRTSLGKGELTARVVGTYLMELSNTNNGLYVDNAGAVSTNTPDSKLGVPKVKLVAKADYKLDDYSVGIDVRYLGKAKLNTYWTAVDVADSINRVPAYMTLNVRGSYDLQAFGAETHLFVTVENVFDRDPPIVAPTSVNSGYQMGTNVDNYDPLGRYIKIGVRAKF